jgi:integrating conjugative element relaxase (TIGR03760 family)
MEVVLFHRQRKSTLAAHSKSLKDLTSMVSPTQFLADNKRQALLQKINGYSGLESSRYDSLCITLIDNLINYCQNLPESANSYYAQAGGLVEHALNRTEAALGLFQEFMIQDQAGVFSEEQKLWQYALFSAAILQGIGKLYMDYRVNLFDVNGQLLKQWNPLLESLGNIGSYYDYEFKKEGDIEFRRRLNLLMAKALMPVSGFTWIASNPQVLEIWLALLNEDQRSAGTLGAILIRADSIAIQRYLAEFLLRAQSGRSGPFGRAGTFSGGVPESVSDKEQALGIEFIHWVMKSIENGLIMINKAPLMMVPGGFLMCAEMFQLFVREHPEYKNWQAVQKAMLSLGLHRLAADGSLTSRFEQTQNQQMHSGVLLADYAVALPEVVTVHNLNTGKTQRMSATEFIHSAQENSHFMQHSTLMVEPMQKLSATGQWQNVEYDAPTTSHGVKSGG